MVDQRVLIPGDDESDPFGDQPDWRSAYYQLLSNHEELRVRVTKTVRAMKNPMWYGMLDEDTAITINEILEVLQPGSTPKPPVEMVIDYTESIDSWSGRCAEHGLIVQVGGSVEAHDAVVDALALHDKLGHGGDGTPDSSAYLAPHARRDLPEIWDNPPKEN